MLLVDLCLLVSLEDSLSSFIYCICNSSLSKDYLELTACLIEMMFAALPTFFIP